MNKNTIVASFSIEKTQYGDRYIEKCEQKEKLPVGFRDIESWIGSRKASKHNHHLREIMRMCGCEKTEGFIRLTHAASLNDTFWIKKESESIQWDDISLYRNQFNEVVSKLAFEGIGLHGIEFSSSVPELSTEGSFRKCWKRERDGIYLYKRGQSGARNAGLEPYCEMMASELASKICKDSISYDLVRMYGEIASKCRLFTDEDTGFVPFARLGIQNSPVAMLEYYEKLGSENAFRQLMVADAVIFNVDRHFGNHGILVNNTTLQPLKMAPCFDLNLALLPYVEKEEFAAIGDKMLGYGPRIGDDFTQVGQTFLTPEIRADLISLKGFRFSFQGDDKFPEWRVKALEEIVNKQIEAIISKEKLTTKDVFVPGNTEELNETGPQLQEQEEKANWLINKMSGKFPHWETMLNLLETHIELIVSPERGIDIYIDMRDDSMTVEKNGIELSYYEIMVDKFIAKNYSALAEFLDMDNSKENKERRKKDGPTMDDSCL